MQTVRQGLAAGPKKDQLECINKNLMKWLRNPKITTFWYTNLVLNRHKKAFVDFSHFLRMALRKNLKYCVQVLSFPTQREGENPPIITD